MQVIIDKLYPHYLLYVIAAALGLLAPWPLCGQEYNYVHYDTKDGLPSSTIYDITQDKSGFMWFATDAGLSRFDGTHFKTYTTTEGLPENEILKVHADARGRVWIAPFKNTLCYYYEGKIHNAENDSTLKKLHLHGPIVFIIENAVGDLLFYSQDYRAIIGTYHQEDITFSQPISNVKARAANYKKEGFLLEINDSIFIFRNNRLTYSSAPTKAKPGRIPVIFFEGGGFISQKPPKGFMMGDISVLTTPNATINSMVFINTTNGSWMMDTTRLGHYDLFLKGKQTTHGFIDHEKSIWFTTLNEGVYKLTSREFKNWQFRKNQSPEVFSLEKQGNALLAGMGFGWLYTLSHAGIDSINFHRFEIPFIDYTGRILSIKKNIAGDLILGIDGILLKKSHSGFHPASFGMIKSVEVIDSTALLVATGRMAALLRPNDLSIKDTIWPYRATAATYYNNAYYIGTTDGLFIVRKDKSVYNAGLAIAPLRFRISYFAQSADGHLWVGTNGGGIVCLKGDKMVANITTQQGLNSNACRTLFIHENTVWAGTDRGISKINIADPRLPVISYSTLDGLPSNIINAIYVDSNQVYVGSPAGLTAFDEKKVFSYSRCDLQILDVQVSGESLPVEPTYTLGHKNNNFKIEFTGISFKSGGDILYRYRLKGLKDSWDSTRQNILDYPSLPSGEYTLELMAINKFGVVSNMITIPIVVETPYWQTWWFRLLVIVLVIGATALAVTWRFNSLRKREQEKAALQQKVHDLEQLALRSQMNPHFIFNCLNSIQNFIINNDLETTNRYLTEFAYLIRQTLDSAEEGTISIYKEVQYLTRYIELERMRFGNSFDYTIEVDPRIDQEYVHIPGMILQPYVENGIRHGIRYKTNGKGVIRVNFQQDAHGLLCIVEDNGIGRREAVNFRSAMHIEYQSKGMSLTAERIKALNRQHQASATIEITDLADEQGQPAGTRVSILFPDKIIVKLS